MPELPEVEALARFLTDRLTDQRVADIALASLSAIKTYAPPVTDLLGQHVVGVRRHGKFLDLTTDGGLHLVWHLSRAGWVGAAPRLPGAPFLPHSPAPPRARVGRFGGRPSY